MISIILSAVLFVGFSWFWVLFSYAFFWCMGEFQGIKGAERLVKPLIPSFLFFLLLQAMIMKGLF